MKNVKLNVLYLSAVAALFSDPALAGLNNYTQSNGTAVININKADANGLSHNTYQNFNVTRDGLVLNNSITDLVRENGNISRNSNLDKPAKVILNEVISDNASSLNGFIEVAGQKADVIIANPNGIACSGCGFINTRNATLTTGIPAFTDGKLTAIDVDKGMLTIRDQSLKGADYTTLLAQKIAIQGQVDTGNLRAVAGQFTYYTDTARVTPDGNHRVQGNSIDISALGGVTAGLISLHTTEAGAGVNNHGVLNGSSLAISSSGLLTNNGTMKARENIALSSAGEFENRGDILSQGNLAAKGNSGLTNTGSLQGVNVSLESGKNIGLLSGDITARSNIALLSAGNIENHGDILSQHNLSARSDGGLTSTGSLQGENVILESGKNISFMSGKVTAKGNVALSAAGDIENRSDMTSQRNFSVQAKNRLINLGSMRGVMVSLNAGKEIALLSGDVTATASASLSADRVNNAAAFRSVNAYITSQDFRNAGSMVSDGMFIITASQTLSNSGSLEGSILTLSSRKKVDNTSQGNLRANILSINSPKMKSVKDLGGNYNASMVTFR